MNPLGVTFHADRTMEMTYSKDFITTSAHQLQSVILKG